MRWTLLCCANRNPQGACVRPVFSPLHIHCGNIKSDSFQPQHHEETLGEGTVADALTIAPRLEHKHRENVAKGVRHEYCCYFSNVFVIKWFIIMALECQGIKKNHHFQQLNDIFKCLCFV